MSVETATARCGAQACIFNLSGQCRHALQPMPAGCAHRRTVPTLSTDGLVTFVRRPHDGGPGPFVLSLARRATQLQSSFVTVEATATAAA